jgi:hypothetical protein
VKIASEALTRVCVLGGDWNGRAIAGDERLRAEPYMSQAYASMESFGRVIQHAIELRPYVDYDDTRGCVVRVTDAVVCEERVEVRELRVSVGQTVKEWYGCGLVQRRN